MSAKQENTQRKVVRQKRHSGRNRPPVLHTMAPEWGLASLILLALLFLINPFQLFVKKDVSGSAGTQASFFSSNLLYWFADRGGATVIGFLLLMLALVGVIARARWRILRQSLWYRQRCPQCDEVAVLKRMKRQWHHRVAGIFGIPTRPYICANCHWHGTRIDETRIR